MGPRALQSGNEREYNDPFIQKWEDQFKDVNKITISALSQIIQTTTNTDFMFVVNFLVLFGNTMGSYYNGGEVKYNVIKNVMQMDDATQIDWCTYIWECAKNSKLEWKLTKENWYYGPVTFLMVSSTYKDFFLFKNHSR